MADFNNGLFGCFDDITVCLLVAFVPCYQIAQTKAKLDGRECHACDCCCWTPNLSWYIRQQIRAKYGYEFNFVTDCLLVAFCTSCVDCQHAREVNAAGNGGERQKLVGGV